MGTVAILAQVAVVPVESRFLRSEARYAEAMFVARLPQLGSKPVTLTVKLKALKDQSGSLSKGLQDLYRKGELTDVALLCSEQRFLAHRAVLASQSRCFREGLAAQPLPGPGLRHEVRLEVANPEAVKIMLDYLYMLDAA